MGYLNDTVASGLWGLQQTSATIIAVDITPLDGVHATQTFIPDTPGDWHGGQGGDFAPQVAVMVKFQTANRGRSFRGRLFLPFTAEASIGQGHVTSGDLGATQTAWEDFADALIAVDLHLVVASYKLESAEDVTTVTVEGETGTQRRRQERNRT